MVKKSPVTDKVITIPDLAKALFYGARWMWHVVTPAAIIVASSYKTAAKKNAQLRKGTGRF
jgi:hypothetical protein